MYAHIQDVSTLKDDVKSLNRLLPIIKDLANNETDYRILNYYQEIIYSTDRSIVVLNDLVSPTSIVMAYNIYTTHFITDCSIGES